MAKIEKAGAYSPGNRVKPIRDLSHLAKRIKSSLFDEQYPVIGTSYLIDECHDNVPPLYVKDENGDDTDVLDCRRLLHVRPALLQFDIKLFGFEMDTDRMGMPYYFKSNLFVPDWYNV